MTETGADAGEAGKRGKKERIRRFLLDLTSLEITTIVTENITGESMPEPREALARLRSEYASKLGEIAREYGDAGGGPEAAFGGSVLDAVSAGAMDFQAEGRMAEALMAQQGAGVSDDDRGNLARIRANSERLERLAEKLGVEPAGGASLRAADEPAADVELAPEEMVALRKMWELGTEPIALQTVIQAGGDIITRIHPDHAGAGSVLLDLHRTGIETAVGIWRTLVDTAVQLLEKILSR